MPHLLSQLDNQTLPAFQHRGKDLKLRILTSKNSAKENPEIARLLGTTAAQTQQRLIDSLKSDNPKINQDWFERPMRECTQEEMLGWVEEGFSQEFDRYENYTAMALEDDSGKILCAMSFAINDADTKKCVKVEDDEKTPVIFFEMSQTSPENSGQGFLKIMRSFLLPKVLIGAEFDEQIYMANSMKRMMATNPDSGEVVYDGMSNFKIHGKIFGFMAPETVMIERWRDNKDAKDRSLEDSRSLPISHYFIGSEVNEEELRNWIAESKAQHPDKHLEGCFMKAPVESLTALIARAKAELFVEKEGGILGIKEKTPRQAMAAQEVETLELNELNSKAVLSR